MAYLTHHSIICDMSILTQTVHSLITVNCEHGKEHHRSSSTKLTCISSLHVLIDSKIMTTKWVLYGIYCLTLSSWEFKFHSALRPLYDDRKLPSWLNQNVCAFVDECVICNTAYIDVFSVQVLEICLILIVHC